MTNSLLRALKTFLRSPRGAGLSDYAIIVAVLSILSIGTVSLFSAEVRQLFQGTNDAISGDIDPTDPDGGETGPVPTLALSASSATLPANGSVTFTWTSSNATTLSATYKLTGTCARKTANGTGPHPLAWTDEDGAADVSWSADLAGCSFAATMKAVNTDGQISRTQTVSVATLDVTPEGLSFPAVSGAEPDLPVESAEVTVSGIEGATTITVTDGGIALGGTDSYSSSVTVNDGDTVKLRATAPAGFSATRQVAYSAGSMSGSWSITTRAAIATPDSFSFLSISGANPNSEQTSAPVVIDGFDGTLTVLVTDGASVAVDGGAFGPSADITAGQELRVRMNAPAAFSDSATATVTIGSASSDWSVSTRAQDTAPDAFTIADTNNATPGTTYTTPVLQAAGFDGPVTLSANNGALVSTDTTFTPSVDLHPGQLFRVRADNAANWGESFVVTVSAGDASATWTINTRAKDTEPFLLGFGTVNVAPDTDVQSSAQNISGFDSPITLTAINGTISVDGGAPAASVSVNQGQEIQLHAHSSAATDGSGTVIVTLKSGTFTVGTWTVNSNATGSGAIAFNDANDVNPNAIVESNAVQLSGFTGTLSASCTGGCTAIAKNGVWGGATVTGFQANDTIAIRTTAAATFGTQTSAGVTVGLTTSAPWTVSTRLQDTTPAPFAFNTRPAAEPGVLVDTLAVQPVTDFDGPLAVTATGGAEVSKNGTTWFAGGNLTVNPGDTLWVRLTSSSDDSGSGSASTTVTVGGASASFTVATKDGIADAFSFTPTTPQLPNTVKFTSTTAPLAGFSGSKTVTATSGAEVSVNGSTWFASGDLQAISGQTLYVRLTSPATAGGSISTTVTVAGKSASWTLTSELDTTADAFAFPAPLKVAAGATNQTVTTTAPIAGLSSGVSVPVTFTAAQVGTAQVSKDSVNWFNSGALQVSNGDNIVVRFSVASSDITGAGFVSSTVTAGGQSATARVNTLDLTPTLTPGDFGDILNANPAASIQTPNTLTLSGLDAAITVTCQAGCTSVVKNGVASGTSVSASNTDTIAITASNTAFSTQVNTSVNVGPTNVTWTVITRAQDTIPTFSPADFTDTAGWGLNNTATDSNAVTLAAGSFDGPITVSCGANCTAIAKNGVWGGSVSVNPGDSIAVRMTSSGAFSTPKTAVVNVGGTSLDFTATTRAAASCTTQTKSWTTGSYTCSASATAGPNGQNRTISDPNPYPDAGNYGSAVFQCQDSVWVKQSGTCSHTDGDPDRNCGMC